MMENSDIVKAKKKLYVAANWKMYKSPDQARQFLVEIQKPLQTLLQKSLQKTDHTSAQQIAQIGEIEIILFPSAICGEAVSQAIKKIDANRTQVAWGLQNAYFKAEGAFTGESSGQVAKAMGAKYQLIGHSERRALFFEKDELIADKVKFAQEMDLIPMLCVGETLAEREQGQIQTVLSQQILVGLSKLDQSKPWLIAYEPVWAIGTGKVATPQQADEAHLFIRTVLAENGFSRDVAILYGGSVKPENAKELLLQQNIDGFLVGGASLDAGTFAKIIEQMK